MWRADGRGGVTASTESFSLYVTHNGDYDFARDAAGRYRTHHELSAWLAAVLGCPPTAKCDSVCLAGERPWGGGPVLHCFRVMLSVWAGQPAASQK